MEMFFLSYVNETVYFLWNLPFFQMVLPKTNIFSFLKPWAGNGSTKESDQIRSDQSLSRVQLFATPWIAALQASLSITNSQSLLKLMSIELVMPSNYLILYHPFSSCLQSFPASGSFPMKNDALCIRWPKYWGFSISPSTEYSGLISFRVYQEAFNRRLPVCCFGSVRNPLFLIYSWIFRNYEERQASPQGWGIQAFPSLIFQYCDKYPLPSYEPYGKSDCLQLSLSF